MEVEFVIERIRVVHAVGPPRTPDIFVEENQAAAGTEKNGAEIGEL